MENVKDRHLGASLFFKSGPSKKVPEQACCRVSKHGGDFVHVIIMSCFGVIVL